LQKNKLLEYLDKIFKQHTELAFINPDSNNLKAYIKYLVESDSIVIHNKDILTKIKLTKFIRANFSFLDFIDYFSENILSTLDDSILIYPVKNASFILKTDTATIMVTCIFNFNNFINSTSDNVIQINPYSNNTKTFQIILNTIHE
jgi:hypothetical protein